MARKPEATFVGSIHRHLDLEQVHAEGMANDYRGGTPDKYYDGTRGDIWVEYKFLQTIPPIIDLRSKTQKVVLSALQAQWINRRAKNGGNAYVIVGCKEGGVILTHGQWNEPIARKDFIDRLLTRKELAHWITKKVIK